MLLLLFACDGLSKAPPGAPEDSGQDSYLPVDLDGDHYGRNEDCDDQNAAIHPGAIEVAYNDGIDQNCDGSDAAPMSTASATYTEERGMVTDVTRAGDMNGDGFADMATADNMGNIYIIVGESSPTSTVLAVTDVVHRAVEPEAIPMIAGIGDYNGDGLDDLVSAQSGGGISLLLGSESLPGGGPGVYSYSGSAVVLPMGGARGDVNGDGVDDLLLGANYGDGLLLLGGDPPAEGVLEAMGILYDGEDGGQFQGPVAMAGDVDGDGFDDMLVGAPENQDGNDPGDCAAGAAYLVQGSALPVSAALEGMVQYTGADPDCFAGGSVAGVGDVDADGYDDVLVGREGYSYGGSTYSWWADGRVWLLSGRADPASGPLVDAGSSYFSTWSGYRYAAVRLSAGGDMNDDGFADMILENDRDTVVVFGPPTPGTWRLDDAVLAYRGDDTFSGVGDVNADGREDLLIGDEGSAYLFLK